MGTLQGYPAMVVVVVVVVAAGVVVATRKSCCCPQSSPPASQGSSVNVMAALREGFKRAYLRLRG